MSRLRDGMRAVDDRDAWEVVLEALARPIGSFEASSRSEGGWQAETIRGGNPFGADISTVRCIKERSSPTRRLYYLSFDATLPHWGDEKHAYSHLLLLQRDAAGHWRHAGGAGGGGQLPPRSQPWLNLAGGSGGDHFYAGGRLDRAGADAIGSACTSLTAPTSRTTRNTTSHCS